MNKYLSCGLQEGMVTACSSCCRAFKKSVQDLLPAGTARLLTHPHTTRLQRRHMLRPARLQLLPNLPAFGTCTQLLLQARWAMRMLLCGSCATRHPFLVKATRATSAVEEVYLHACRGLFPTLHSHVQQQGFCTSPRRFGMGGAGACGEAALGLLQLPEERSLVRMGACAARAPGCSSRRHHAGGHLLNAVLWLTCTDRIQLESNRPHRGTEKHAGLL